MFKQFIKLVNLFAWVLSICAVSLSANPIPDYSNYAQLLDAYVVGESVNYTAWAQNEKDLSALKEFVEKLGQATIESLTKAEQAAFYINLYNASMLHIVLERYPINSVKTVGMLPFSIFKKDIIVLGDRKVSLDDIEKGILLNQYFDPRIHFALNCASKGCPPLRAEPYLGSRLEAQLEAQANLFARSKYAVTINKEDKTIAYSELFKWYAKDFGNKNPAEYLNQYRDEDLPIGYSINWIPYDWDLNELEEVDDQ